MARPRQEASTSQSSREKMDRSMTLVFRNGARHVVHPTKAFDGDWRGLADYIAGGEPYQIERQVKHETPEPKQ